MQKSSLKWVLNVPVASALFFIVALIAIAIFIPDPTPFQKFVFRIVLALSAAAFGATISGIFEIRFPLPAKGAISAGGALGLFTLIFLINPPELVTADQNSTQFPPKNSNSTSQIEEIRKQDGNNISNSEPSVLMAENNSNLSASHLRIMATDLNGNKLSKIRFFISGNDLSAPTTEDGVTEVELPSNIKSGEIVELQISQSDSSSDKWVFKSSLKGKIQYQGQGKLHVIELVKRYDGCSVEGEVLYDDDRTAVPDAVVMIPGSDNFTTTKKNGYFKLHVRAKKGDNIRLRATKGHKSREQYHRVGGGSVSFLLPR